MFLFQIFFNFGVAEKLNLETEQKTLRKKTTPKKRSQYWDNAGKEEEEEEGNEAEHSQIEFSKLLATKGLGNPPHQ